MMTYVLGAICLLILVWYVLIIRKHKFTTKSISRIGITVAIAFVLHLIVVFRLPQGGTINLFSFLPIMLLSVMFGKEEGLTAGLIFGALELINDPFVINPVQFLLDYSLSTMPFGLTCIFGTDKKYKMILGAILAVVLNLLSHTVSGAVFFGQYAPSGMNVWLYSVVYNVSTAGIDGLMNIIALAIFPMGVIKKISRQK
ncbi:MAG: energy-coupled thiamine transporter ThiT [Sarcina sp.]